MYTDEDGSVSALYISSHTGHELGSQEFKCLLLPTSTKDEIAVKVTVGIPPDRSGGLIN